MNISEYFTLLRDKSQKIFDESIENIELLGRVHQMTSIFYDFSKQIVDKDESKMLRMVCAQLETGCVALNFGLYRQALASLRLAFELGLGLIYFSANKLEHKEWIKGTSDIKWSSINDEEVGVFSYRFADAFFPKLRDDVLNYRNKSKTIYRSLSEYVHGNYESWEKSGIVLEKKENLVKVFNDSCREVFDILLFALCVRYINDFDILKIDVVQGILSDELNHIAAIREILGGPKEIE